MSNGANPTVSPFPARCAGPPTDTVTVTLRNDYGDAHPMKYFGTPLINGAIDDRNKRLNYNVADAEM